MRKTILASLVALALALSSCSHVKCAIPQSPRKLWLYDGESKTSIVERGPDNSVFYTPRGEKPRYQLFLCSQHYHCYPENYQQCLNVPPPTGKETCKGLAAGDWIEVHTAYAAKVASPCNKPESLDCCLTPPVLVRGYHAKITTGGNDPLPDPWDLPLIQWSGSSTGPDKTRNECKAAAQWSFTPGCELRVSKEVVEKRFRHPDPPRALQPPNRLSKDLTLVTPP